MKLLLLPLTGLFATISFAGASTILHTLDPQAYRDEAALYPTVGKVTGPGNSGSGVMLFDRWVLTSGYISQGKQSGGVFTIGGVDYTIASTLLHP